MYNPLVTTRVVEVFKSYVFLLLVSKNSQFLLFEALEIIFEEQHEQLQ